MGYVLSHNCPGRATAERGSLQRVRPLPAAQLLPKYAYTLLTDCPMPEGGCAFQALIDGQALLVTACCTSHEPPPRFKPEHDWSDA